MRSPLLLEFLEALEDKSNMLEMKPWKYGRIGPEMLRSSQKSKLIILKGNMNARPPVIKYRNFRIGKVGSAPYLGIEIDTGLTFLPYVKKQG